MRTKLLGGGLLAVALAIAAAGLFGREPERVVQSAEQGALPAVSPEARLAESPAPLQACSTVGRAGATRGAAQAPGFALRFGDELSTLRLMSVFVEPGSELGLEVVLSGPGATYRAGAERGTLTGQAPERWTYKAPQTPGIYRVAVIEDGSRGDHLPERDGH